MFQIKCCQCKINLRDEDCLNCGDYVCKECLKCLDSFMCPLCDTELDGPFVDFGVIEEIENNIEREKAKTLVKSHRFCDLVDNNSKPCNGITRRKYNYESDDYLIIEPYCNQRNCNVCVEMRRGEEIAEIPWSLHL